MMKRQVKKAAAMILAGLLTVICSLEMTSTALADDPVLKLTIEEISSTDGKIIPGVELSVYQVASMDDKGIYSLSEAFKDSGLKVYSLEKADAQLEAAKKMEVFIKNKNIDATQHGVTGDNGELVMSGLNKGLYLVLHTGTPGTKLIVQSEPFFVSLPMLDTETDTWLYDVIAQPKVTTKEPETNPSEPETNPSQPETNPSEPGTNPSESETNPSGSETNPSESETTPGGGGGGNGGGGNGGGITTVIEDTPTPLASFPAVPAEPELITIEDAPVPLAGLPMIPKLGDMGAAGYLAGLLISLAMGAAAFIKQRDYSAKEAR